MFFLFVKPMRVIDDIYVLSPCDLFKMPENHVDCFVSFIHCVIDLVLHNAELKLQLFQFDLLLGDCDLTFPKQLLLLGDLVSHSCDLKG